MPLLTSPAPTLHTTLHTPPCAQVKRKNVQAALTAPGAGDLALSCLEMATIRCDVGTPQVQLLPEHWRLQAPAPEDAAEAEKEFEVGLGAMSCGLAGLTTEVGFRFGSSDCWCSSGF